MINNIKMKSGKGNSADFKRMQQIRSIVQIITLTLLVAGIYFSIKPVLILLLPLAFVAGNFFCGWICPYGSAQDIFGRIGSLFWKKKLKMPSEFQQYAQYSRYLLMIALLLIGSQEMASAVPINAYKSFMAVAGGRVVQTAALTVVGVFLVIALFFERPFCNYFCSEGIKYGLASLTRFLTIKRNASTCVNCKQCDKACPMNIQLSVSTNVRSAQCINCFHCVAACPVDNTLTYGKVSFKRKIENTKETHRGGSTDSNTGLYHPCPPNRPPGCPPSCLPNSAICRPSAVIACTPAMTVVSPKCRPLCTPFIAPKIPY